MGRVRVSVQGPEQWRGQKHNEQALEHFDVADELVPILGRGVIQPARAPSHAW